MRTYSSLAVIALVISLLAFGAFKWVDYPLATYLHRNVPETMLGMVSVFTHIGNGVIWLAISLVAALGLFAISRIRPHRPQLALLAVKLSYLFVSLLSAAVVVFLVKEVVGRLRPTYYLAGTGPHVSNFIQHHNALSFPSGHSATAFAAAVALGYLCPRWRAVFLLFAVLVAASRVVLQVHYVSDVLAGGFVGFAMAVLCYRWFKRFKHL